jgi:hypothetical protein
MGVLAEVAPASPLTGDATSSMGAPLTRRPTFGATRRGLGRMSSEIVSVRTGFCPGFP